MRRTALVLVRLLVRLFFRRVEVYGLEHIPQEGGIVVAWHPNGLIDPGLILATFPRPIVFGARSGLFGWPILGWIMRALGTVPILRADDGGDADARKKANAQSILGLAGAVARGSYAALFPEGKSHDQPRLLDLKTGAARLYYEAHQLAGAASRPAIIPVGLHYDKKRAFRSRALVIFHPPMTLPPDLIDPLPTEKSGNEKKEQVKQLTAAIERVLTEVVFATDDWELHYLMQRARRIVRTERARRAGSKLEPPAMAERAIGFQRIRIGYNARRKTHPEEVAQLKNRLAAYHDDLRSLRIEDHELDADPPFFSFWLALLLVGQAALVYLLLPPVLVLGYVVNGLPALALRGVSRGLSAYKKDEATVKVLLGVMVFPATWIGVGLLAAAGHLHLAEEFPNLPQTPVLAGLTTALLCAVGGAIGLRYQHLAEETARAVRVRLTKRRRAAAVARLRQERAALFDGIMKLAEGLELPESVQQLMAQAQRTPT